MSMDATNDDVVAAIYDLLESVEKTNRDVCDALSSLEGTVMMFSGN